jgi:hypothetical protein
MKTALNLGSSGFIAFAGLASAFFFFELMIFLTTFLQSE